MTRPWTEAEMRCLRPSAKKKVSAEDIAKTLGRHVGPVKKPPCGSRKKDGQRTKVRLQSGIPKRIEN